MRKLGYSLVLSGLLALACAGVTSLDAGAGASGFSGGTVTWTGNGTVNGQCTGSEDLGLTVPAGEQAWLFILTQPAAGPWELTTNLGDASGTQEGNGAVHFVIVTALNAVLTSASAAPGNDGSVLTVSGCQFGSPVTTTTTTTPQTTTTTLPQTTTTTVQTSTTTTVAKPTTTTTSGAPSTTTSSTAPSGPCSPSGFAGCSGGGENCGTGPTGSCAVAPAAAARTVSPATSPLALTGAPVRLELLVASGLLAAGGACLFLGTRRRRA